MADNLVDKLKELGLNSYEAKVYLALLRQNPATGYEISKESGVPQARAYDTLKALEANNIVVAMGGKPVTYTPISPHELLDRWERSFRGSVNYLREALPSLANETVEPIVNLRGKEALFKHALDMINNAQHSLFVQIWREDAQYLASAFQEAKKRGVIIRMVGYDDCNIEGVDIFQHERADAIQQAYGLRWFILSADDKEGLVGTISNAEDRQPQAIITKNPGIVLLIKEFIVHDIFILDIEKNLPEEMNRIYGSNRTEVRQKIEGSESKISFRLAK
ncbi:MAG TPA: helix-turn-helix domain-containing protein [Oculatellaceae cyanobacterium]